MSKKWKNRVLEEIEIQDIAAEGKCIARYENRVIFIAGNKVAPGDKVDLRIIRQRRNYLEAIPIKFHHYSEQRVEPFCAHFGQCGGCKWQHIPYEQQLEYKFQQVKDNLERLAKVELPPLRPIVASQENQYYRNKLEYTFSHQRWLSPEEIADKTQFIEEPGLGFHVPGRFDKVLDVKECFLQAAPSNSIRLAIREYALQHDLSFFDIRNQEGLLRNVVIRSTETGDLMIMPIFFYEDQEKREGFLSFLQKEFPQITSLYYIINPKKNDSYQDLEPQLFAGKAYIEEEMEGLTFRIGPKSFYQTNSKQAFELYKMTRHLADLSGQELVYDLYTGTGTIANFVARKAKKVIGIEYVEAAIEDAKVNSSINNISNTDFFAGDMKDILTEDFIQSHGTPDLIITDPPRAGMHESVIEQILKVAPDRIVYVSCNPATQARDIALLDAKYKISAIQPVDMFPHTQHVENIVRLDKRG